MTLKVKFSDFQQITRSRTLPGNIESEPDLDHAAVSLLSVLFPMDKTVRLLGVSISALNTDDDDPETPQLSLDL